MDKMHLKKVPSLDLEDKTGSVEITPANVFPLQRLKGLQAHMKNVNQPDSYFLEDRDFNVVDKLYPIFLARWVRGEHDSFLAFKGMTHILKGCLMLSSTEPWLFHKLMKIGGSDSVRFLAQVVPYLVDSEMVQGTNVIDLLLTNLAVITVKTGENYVEEFIHAVPFFSGFYVGAHRKQFEELHDHIFRSHQVSWDETGQPMVSIVPHYLKSTHFPMRKVIVSNAPPVKLHRSTVYRKDRKYSCEFTAGGLVSGIKPSLEQSDIWVSYLDPSLLGLDLMPQDLPGKIFRESLRIPAQYRRAPSLNMDTIDSQDELLYQLQDFLWEKTENDFLSLQDRLNTFAEQNFQINPLVILKNDHRAFYNGVSNGLFWPAFHNLPEYIIEDYKVDDQNLADDWIRYIKVNFHFAIHTARNSRRQDFLWIHDYHLMLCGQILRSLDPTLNCSFFLHIPFLLSDDFMEKYYDQGVAVLRGLLGFKRVGFQTSRDCQNFIRLVAKHIASSQTEEKPNFPKGHGFTVTHGAWKTDVGTFPISIKMDTVLKISTDKNMQTKVATLRSKLLKNTLTDVMSEMKVFLSVERFDYTKGILERLSAIDKYLASNPSAQGKHIFYQIAARSRADVESYRKYQQTCLDKIHELNSKYQKTETIHDVMRTWVPIIVDTQNVPYDDVMALYKACDLVVVTPIADGMNLVIKEAIISNPSAVFVFSRGAGAVRQFDDEGLSTCYHTVNDIKDPEDFSQVLSQAVKVHREAAVKRGQRLYNFVIQHDIGYWISSYLSPNWTHNVIQIPSHGEMPMFRAEILEQLQEKRKRVVKSVLRAHHISEAEEISLTNVLRSVKAYSKDEQLQILSKNGAVQTVFTKSLLSGINLDIDFLKCFWLSEDVSVLVSMLSSHSGMPAGEFNRQLAFLENYLSQIGTFDVLMMEFDPYFCLSPAGAIKDNEVSPYSMLANLVATLLVTKYVDRHGAELVVLSSMSKDEVRQCSCFPDEMLKILDISGNEIKWSLDLVANKRVVVAGKIAGLGHLIEWMESSVHSLFIVPVNKTEGPFSKVVSPKDIGYVNSPAVFYAAFASFIEKPIALDLSYPEG